MNIKELWIGESVEIVTSNRVGKFEGISKDGRARISHNGKIYLVRASNLKIYVEPKVDRVKELMNEINQKSDACKLGSTNDEIDLHINILNPSLTNSLPEHILNNQLSACKAFVNQSIAGRAFFATIIHGKGTGVLRSEVLALLKNYNQIDRVEEIKDGGAQRVYFKY